MLFWLPHDLLYGFYWFNFLLFQLNIRWGVFRLGRDLHLFQHLFNWNAFLHTFFSWFWRRDFFCLFNWSNLSGWFRYDLNWWFWCGFSRYWFRALHRHRIFNFFNNYLLGLSVRNLLWLLFDDLWIRNHLWMARRRVNSLNFFFCFWRRSDRLFGFAFRFRYCNWF